jgi:LacI family transcriptional regulator
VAYASLKDVAARAGVSFQTASKVLNGQQGAASAATRERIRAAADELGYVPNAHARFLVRSSTVTIGILAGDLTDPALIRFVVAAQGRLEDHGHTMVVATVRTGTDPAKGVRKLLEHRVDGILAMVPAAENDPRLGEALRGTVPVVSLNHIAGGGIPLVGSDHAQTGVLAANHLLERGHRQMGMITGHRERRVVVSRSRGFRAALRSVGIELPARNVVPADWTAKGAYHATEQLLHRVDDITAIFTHSDQMAMGVLRSLRDQGIRVPQDCALVGCDDLAVSPYLTPSLTSVHVPFEETGVRAADLLLTQIGGANVPRIDLLPVHLVARASTGPG